jgi:outer membrane immunogenic protein
MMRLQSVVAALALTAAVGSASAADMSVKAPALPAPVATWTGIYGGVHGGYLWGHTKAEENGVVTEPDAATNGAIGGVLAGYNWQTGLFVLGVEADIGATDAHGTGFRSSTTEPNQYDFNWVGHVRGRIGYDYNQWLLFVAGGLAVADFTFRPGEVTIECIAMGGRFTGFSVGGGVERAIAPGLIVRGEYIYDDFGSKTYSMTTDTYKVSLTGHIARGAIILKIP